ncbi:LCP family protein [Nocardioides pyridinolyticus]
MTVHLTRATRRALWGLAVCLTLVVVLLASTTLWLRHELGEIDRLEGVFDALGDRPERPSSGPGAEALNVLLLGTDRRSDVATTGDAAEAAAWVPGAQRSDLMMLLHIDADRDEVTVISLPRDSWVDVPGYGMSKINAAYSYGGPALAVRTVEQLTDVHVDHLAVVDWTGFRELTDAVGGITVDVPETVHDSARGITWAAGEHRLDGQQALDYVGQRYGLPGGDLDRVRRQQVVFAHLAAESLDQRSSPRLVVEFIDLLARHVSVDDRWSSSEMASLGWSLRHVGRNDVHHLTVPVAGLGWEETQSVVRLDLRAGADLWAAVRLDRLDEWTDRRSAGAAPQVVR